MQTQEVMHWRGPWQVGLPVNASAHPSLMECTPFLKTSLAMALKGPGNQGPCCGLQWTLAEIRKHVP